MFFYKNYYKLMSLYTVVILQDHIYPPVFLAFFAPLSHSLS